MARTDTISDRATTGRPVVELAAAAFGATFVLVGILGFVPGVTQNYDAMEFAGRNSGAELLGIFQVSILHNLVHLLFGVAGLVAARTVAGARSYLLFGGGLYAGLGVYGIAIDLASEYNFVPINHADNWLHLALGGAMIALGAALSPRSSTS